MISNQTNLALKGMIGIQAMAVIAQETGHTADASNYSSIAHNYIANWQNLAINKNATPPHTTLSYGNSSSHGESYFGHIHLAIDSPSPQVFFTIFTLMLSWGWAWCQRVFTRCKATSTRRL